MLHPSCSPPAARNPARPTIVLSRLGQVTDAHWDTQMTNAQASSFIFYDHEFIGDTTKLNVLGQKHLVQVAIRLRHVPFPVVVEETPNHQNPKLDAERGRPILDRFAELGLCNLDARVVIAPAIAEGLRGTGGGTGLPDSGRDIDGCGRRRPRRGLGGFGVRRRRVMIHDLSCPAAGHGAQRNVHG